MSRICQITGRRVAVGNTVSHSNHKTKRRFCPNLKVKRFWLEEEKRFVKLKVSTAGMRTINKNGLKKAMEKAVSGGHLGKTLK
jgi:large subunit ribosomal protein L28